MKKTKIVESDSDNPINPVAPELSKALELVANLEKIMIEKGINQSELARKLGIHQTAVNAFFRKKSDTPSLKNLLRYINAIAEISGTTIEVRIVFGEG